MGVVLVVACSCSQSPDASAERAAPPRSASSTIVARSPSPRPIPSTGQIWFWPLARYAQPGGPPTGSFDYLDLFTPNAAWQAAASRIHVLGIDETIWLDALPDSELGRIITDLDRKGIALALTSGPLTATSECGIGIEGFNGGSGLMAARRIRALGGQVRFVAMDEPFHNSVYYQGPNACRWTPERTAREIDSWIRAFHTIFPDALVGDIEPLVADPAAIMSWLDAYSAIAGSPFPFFHLDVDFPNRPGWPESTKTAETMARQRGIAFGLIYIGNSDDPTDASWIRHVEERMAIWEMQYGGKQDHVVIQSWHARPEYLLPETDPTKFTYLVDRYFDVRTSLQLDATTSSGKLLDDKGNGLSAAPVRVTLRPLDGRGDFAEYTATGIVPSGKVEGVVQLNLEGIDGGTGPVDVSVYSVRYQEADGVQRVPNGDFSRGLTNWGPSANAAANVRAVPSDRGGGSMLQITAARPGIQKFVNSAYFSVTPGSTYTVTFSARVAPSSVGTGFFKLVFLEDRTKEAGFSLIRYTPAEKTTMVTTDASGAFAFALLTSGRVAIEAHYAGDATHWQSFANATR